MNECHRLIGLKNVCSTARAPGASRKIAASAPSTTIVLTVETTPARVPLPLENSRGPRPVAVKETAGCPGDIEELGSMPLRWTPGLSCQGWIVGNLRKMLRYLCCSEASVPLACSWAMALFTQVTSGLPLVKTRP